MSDNDPWYEDDGERQPVGAGAGGRQSGYSAPDDND